MNLAWTSPSDITAHKFAPPPLPGKIPAERHAHGLLINYYESKFLNVYFENVYEDVLYIKNKKYKRL